MRYDFEDSTQDVNQQIDGYLLKPFDYDCMIELFDLLFKKD